MALNVQKGTITMSTVVSTTHTVNLAAGFDLRAIQFFLVNRTAAGAAGGNTKFCLGYATNDGGSIQQGCYFAEDLDNVTTTNNGSRATNVAAIYFGSDFEADVTTFSSEQFVLTETVAADAAYVVHYVAYGGSDISKARVFNFACSTAAATQDVTIAASWGQPDLLILMNGSNLAIDGGANGVFGSIGVAKDGASRVSSWWNLDNEANTDAGSRQGSELLVIPTLDGTASPVVDAIASLSAVGAWPTDGFELSYSDQASIAAQVVGLALQGDFTATIGFGTAPTDAAPVSQNLDHGSPPAALFMWGIGCATTAGLTTSDASLLSVHVGASDGTNEGTCGFMTDDGAGTTVTGIWHSTTKAYANYSVGSTPLVHSECDASISGNNFVLDWNDTDTVAREYQWLTMGAAPVAEQIPSLVTAPPIAA